MSATSAHAPATLDPLKDLLAKAAITEVMYTYCRALDRMDRELARSVWHPDAHAGYGDYFVGDVDGFLDFIWTVHPELLGHAHNVTNIMIEVLTPDTAVSECYAIVFLRVPSEAGLVSNQLLSVRYLDRWSCRDGVWALDARQGIADVVNRIDTEPSPDLDMSTSATRRDATDPSYALFERRFRGA